MIRYIMGVSLLLLTTAAAAQEVDTLPAKLLQEVVVIARQSTQNKSTKLLSSLDQYLGSNEQIDMVKRGAYAWEPLLNGMGLERSVITIDGMRIYMACTDKMDPVTSYVEATNLSRAVIQSGQAGSAHGATIAGSIDLVRKKAGFGEKAVKGNAFMGFESNNRQRIIGTDWQYINRNFFADLDLTYRKANNYKDGNNTEVLYSQFTKYNLSATAGFKLSDHEQIEASLIFDKAVDVGYPALPMDVSLAEAIIGSVSYMRHHLSPAIHQWETKFYYNSVTHIMDDTKRPVVPIRMDMPGWSKTSGFYTTINGKQERHNWKATLSAHHNNSLAEMTMFSNTPGEKDMFMLTWPGVHANYAGLFMEDRFKLWEKWSLTGSAGMGVHNNQIKNGFGLKSLQIFYPDMQSSRTRLLKNLSANLQFHPRSWLFSMGASYGERAPSVSEGYGFYLFNSFDRFDYVGNPAMNNEKSLEFNAAAGYTDSRLQVKGQAAFFQMHDYILGIPDANYIPMTIGAAGIKVYEQVASARIWNSSITGFYQLLPALSVSGKAVYRRGVTGDQQNLPLIQPFSYGTKLGFKHRQFSSELGLEGAIRQTKYNPAFGETAAGAYTVINASAGYKFTLHKTGITLNTGVENIFNTYYSTFADWNRIPRMGRNLFMNLMIGF